MRVACLPWYELDETRDAQETVWSDVARRLRAQGADGVPERLTRGMPATHLLSDPALLFGQCCGYDLVYGFADCLKLVATPCYAAPGCAGPRYSSHVLVREDDAAQDFAQLRNRNCAINGFNSHSGTNALRAVAAPLSEKGRFFAGVFVSGSHLASLKLLHEGVADVMAMDCVLHALLVRHMPAAIEGTRIIARTARVPAPPFITATTDPGMAKPLEIALSAALANEYCRNARETLLLERIERLPLSAYGEILRIEADALRLGYTELHATSPAIMR